MVHNEYNVINSFTLEASFFGPEKGLYQDCHFTPPQLEDIGKYFCITLHDYAVMMRSPSNKITLTNKKLGLGVDLQQMYEEIDKFFGSGKDVQNTNYMKFISKGDESDSADDDEPETSIACKYRIF